MIKKKPKPILAIIFNSILFFFESIMAFFIIFYQTLFMNVPSREVKYDKKKMSFKELWKSEKRPGNKPI